MNCTRKNLDNALWILSIARNNRGTWELHTKRRQVSKVRYDVQKWQTSFTEGTVSSALILLNNFKLIRGLRRNVTSKKTYHLLRGIIT